MSADARCKVWLSVIGSPLRPDEVTSIVGLEPTKVFEEGFPTPPHLNGRSTGNIAATNKWEVLIPVEEMFSLDAHLELLSTLLNNGVSEGLKHLANDAIIRIEIQIHGSQELSFSSDFVRTVAEIGGEIDIDVIP